MSYIRAALPLRYVEGYSEDYVYSDSRCVNDWGKISDKGFIELLCIHWKTDDRRFKEHLIKRLSERLNVKIRDKPLSDDKEKKLILKILNVKE